MDEHQTDSNEKDEVTARLRSRLLALAVAHETADAAACLTALSFTSRVHPARHVWVDTDLGGQNSLDLEDRSVEETWDNAVKRFKGLDEDRMVALVESWLSGTVVANLELAQ